MARPRSSPGATRVQLPEYDESLLLDRSYVPLPQDGFGKEPEAAGGLAAARFGAIHTHWAVLLYVAVVVGYLLLLVLPRRLLPTWLLPPHDSFAIEATLHLAVLLAAVLLEVFLRLNHRRRQQLGYLRFYRTTRHLLPVPYSAAATATAALLLVSLWPGALPGLPQHVKLVAISGAECAAACAFAAAYLWRVRQHNRTQAAPDAQLYLQSALHAAPGASLRQQDAVVEQQGELIRFLQRRCDNLAREVLHLQAREDSRWLEQRQGATAVHLEHLLAAREQELRALLAEKEAAHAQGRQTWALLQERTHENSQLQLTKQQQGDENSRLRATLEEWSHRNAKLEQRLNQARLREEELRQQLAAAARPPDGPRAGQQPPDASA